MADRYVAFLRAINVGGHRKIKMADLKQVLLESGFEDVQTYIASGNVLFRHPTRRDPAALRSEMERVIAERFGFDVEAILRSHADIVAMVERDPFSHVTLGKDITGYVTLLSEKPDAKLAAAIEALSNDIVTMTVHGSDVFTTYYRDRGVMDGQGSLDKRFKIVTTTRNWNTMVKLAAM